MILVRGNTNRGGKKFKMSSILEDVKKDLNISPDDDYFDPEIIMHTNTAFSILTQLGVGPKAGFSISDDTAEWTDFIPEDARLNIIKSYVPKKVKTLFDPPNTGPMAEALNKTISELEWRLNVIVDPELEEYDDED